MVQNHSVGTNDDFALFCLPQFPNIHSNLSGNLVEICQEILCLEIGLDKIMKI